jgi:hypothetical protein
MRLAYGWLGAAALAILLTACGDRSGNVPQTVHAQGQTFSHSQTFAFTGKPERFEVPHVKWLHVDVRGAAGSGTSREVARGARVYALIPASLDKELVVYVGGAGNGAEGGFNGGGAGGLTPYCSTCGGYGGGGASDIRLGDGTLGDRVIVAAGAGGLGGDADKSPGGAGGSGGGSVGGSGHDGSGSGSYSCGGDGGSGGTQTAGGAGGEGGQCGGARGVEGTVGIGGAGGAAYLGGGGGGGGGGFYGGGGGGSGAEGESSYVGPGGGGGGGGGSSFVGKRAKNARVWQGWKSADANGLVVISW